MNKSTGMQTTLNIQNKTNQTDKAENDINNF